MAVEADKLTILTEVCMFMLVQGELEEMVATEHAKLDAQQTQ